MAVNARYCSRAGRALCLRFYYSFIHGSSRRRDNIKFKIPPQAWPRAHMIPQTGDVDPIKSFVLICRFCLSYEIMAKPMQIDIQTFCCCVYDHNFCTFFTQADNDLSCRKKCNINEDTVCSKIMLDPARLLISTRFTIILSWSIDIAYI